MALLDFDALSLFFHHYLATELSHLDSSPSPHSSFMSSSTNSSEERPKTPTPTLTSARTVAVNQITPNSKGSAARRRLDGDLVIAPKYQCLDYDLFLLEDVERHKVFVDIEDFMHSVLLVPLDWRVAYGPLIKTVRANKDFQTSLQKYLKICDIPAIKEIELYDDQLEMNNHALATIDKADPGGTSLRFVMNHDKAMAGGIFTANGGLKPDFLLLLAEFLASQFKDGKVPADYRFEGLAWAQVILPWEIKHKNASLDDGMSGKRIKDRNGRDPAETHRRPGPRGASPTDESNSGTRQQNKRKSQENNPEAKRQKTQSVANDQTLVSIHSTLQSVAEGEELDASFIARAKQTDGRRHAMLQVVRYLYEKFGVSALRSHATAGLIDRDHLQFFHANHSTLLVSRAISLREDADVDIFIGILIGLHRLTLRQLGVMDVVDEHRKFLSDSKFYGGRVSGGLKGDYKKMHDGNTLTLRKDDPNKQPIIINLNGILNREPSIIGRSTSTLYGTSDEWPGVNLVIKVSFPSTGRVSEETFLNTATEKAKEFEKDGERYWVLDHLPKLLHAETAVLDEIEENVKELCTMREYVGGEKSSYEERRRRILVYEMLQPLQTLTTARDFVQVFVDIITTHKWLYDQPRILHRDISMDNIMYRIADDGTIYGVLNDFDLASFRDAFGASTSVQRTGTPPFMAMDVLDGRPYHYYRHDLESIFYVMLVIASRHQLQKPNDTSDLAPFLPHHLIRRSTKLPLVTWFDPTATYESLAQVKNKFFVTSQELELTASFESLRPWLEDMQEVFREGISQKLTHSVMVTKYEKSKKAHAERAEIAFADEVGCSAVQPVKTFPLPPPFNDRTLDDTITFKIFVRPAAEVVRSLGGTLRFRYNGPEFVAGD